MKRIIAFVMCLIMMFTLAACGSSTDAPASEQPTAEQPAEQPAAEQPAAETSGETPVSFEIWLSTTDLATDTYYTWLVKLADAYMQAHPNVTIKFTCLGSDASDYSAKWDVAASADNLPDVISCNSNRLDEWAEAGVIVNLYDDLGSDAEFINRFTDGVLEKVNGACGENALYGLPWRSESFGWLYNVELFDQCGLEIPETWDELLHCVEVFNENGIIPIAEGGTDVWAVWGYHPFFTRYGFTEEMAKQIQAGELKYADCEPITKSFARMQELAEAGAFNEDCYTTSHAQALAMFEEGKAAMYTIYSSIEPDLSNPDVANHTRDNAGPEFPDGALSGPSILRKFDWVLALGNVAKSDDAKYAAILDFLKFFASEEGTKIMTDAGYAPATKYDTAKMENVTMLGRDINESYVSDKWLSSDYAFSAWFDKKYTGEYTTVITGVLTQTITAEEAVEILQSAIDNG